MIYTVTLNPGLDRTLTVPEIVHNEVLRATTVRIDLGGKGLNVSRALKALGSNSVAMGFVGGSNGLLMKRGLREIGIRTDFVCVRGETRISTLIVDKEAQEHIKVNEPGPIILMDEQEALVQKIRKRLKPGDFWAFCGSLPLGLPSNFYAMLIRLVQAGGAKAVLDTSGDALREGVKATPYLLKPNLLEIEQATGITVGTEADAFIALETLLNLGVQYVALSMGANGLMIGRKGEIRGIKPPKVPVRSTVGAGDSTLAGILWAMSKNMALDEVARWGVATGTAAVMCEGTGVGDQALVESIYGLLK